MVSSGLLDCESVEACPVSKYSLTLLLSMPCKKINKIANLFRESGGWEAGSPHMLLQNHNAERRESPDTGYHTYRNSPAETEAISRAGYQQTYRLV